MSQVQHDARAQRGPLSYFLSYAPPGPFAASVQPEPDRNVRDFIADLNRAIGQQAHVQPDQIHAYYDQEIPPGADRNEWLRRAIGEAEVFVPLCSPNYFSRSWPGRELASFQIRLERAKAEDSADRIVPVLWAPTHDPSYDRYIQEALAIAKFEPRYEKNGIRGLQDLTSYHAAYNSVVANVAQRIATQFTESPLPPSQVPAIDQVSSAFREPLGNFDILVAAPTLSSVPPGRSPENYGTARADWRPFPGQQLPLAEYARQTAQRLDFQVDILPAGPAADPARRDAGLLLIDPWFLDGQGSADEGRGALESAMRQLPGWVIPVLILGPPVDWEVTRLAEEARIIVDHAEESPTGSARRPVRTVDSLKQFEALVPVLVAEAERQYLRYGGTFGPEPGAPNQSAPGHTAPHGSTGSAPPPAGGTLDE
jgi:FxsC-like protein